MPEPQIPGLLRGTPAEGNPYVPPTSPGYVGGPLPSSTPYAAPGIPVVAAIIPQQRNYRMSGEWRY